jgi:hypothetical protein
MSKVFSCEVLNQLLAEGSGRIVDGQYIPVSLQGSGDSGEGKHS